MRGKIKSLLVTSIASAALFAGLAGVANAADPYGVWVRPSTGTQVQFYNCGGKLCGKIVAVKDRPARRNRLQKGAAGRRTNGGGLLEAKPARLFPGVALEGPRPKNFKGVPFLVWGREK